MTTLLDGRLISFFFGSRYFITDVRIVLTVTECSGRADEFWFA